MTTPSTPITVASETAALAAANEANMCTAYRRYGHWPGAVLDETPERLVCLTGLPHPLLNGVFRPRLAGNNVDGAIKAVIEAAGDLPLYWWVGPSASPDNLEARLEAHGLPYDGDVPGMAADIAAVPTPTQLRPCDGLTVEQVHDEAGIETMVTVLGAVYHFSPAIYEGTLSGMKRIVATAGSGWRYYLARLDGIPVGATALLLAEGVAGLHMVGTLPDVRGRGVASHLVSTSLHDARAAGYATGVLQSSEMGFPLYERLGFRQVCAFRHHVWDPEGNFH